VTVARFHWHSEIVGQPMRFVAILPDSPPPWPMLYLLHGMFGDSEDWLTKGGLLGAMEGWPLAVVCPDGFNGWYTDHDEGPAFFRHFAHELPAFVERVLPVRTDRGGRCVGGLSMGGYGALRLALGEPERFVSAHSHSGGLMHGSRRTMPHTSLDEGAFRRIFGDDPCGSPHDLQQLAANLADQRPAIHIDCGTDDFLYKDNLVAVAGFRDRGLAPEFMEHPGAHDWPYWTKHLPAALAFHGKALGIGREAT
jgi:S-formylglutathione hydrolase FrmB